MSTSGSYNPPAQPECAYEPEMTRAQAIALRDAGQLDPNCVVVITDGPVIGTPGNTSATQIELNPVTPNDIGRTARVHTDFDNIAFAGLYNIDAGPSGTIEELTDHWNNHCTDQEAGDAVSHTVHNQFPWHAAGATLRDNTINDSSLTDWHTAVAAGAVIMDNDLTDAGVHLTGVGAGSSFLRNTIRGPQVTVSSPQVAFTANVIESAPVTFASTAAGSQSFQDNVIRGGTSGVTVANTVATAVAFTGNEIGGGYRVVVADRPTGLTFVRNNKLDVRSTDPAQELLLSGTGSITFNGNTARGASVIKLNAGNTGLTNITDCEFLNGYVVDVAATSTAQITLNGSTFSGHNTTAVDLQIDGSGTRTFNDALSYAHLSQQQYTLVGGGVVGVVAGSLMNGARIIRDPASTANVTVSQTRGSGSLIQGPGATSGSLALTACDINALGTVITQNGPGSILANSCRLAANISNAATATRGMSMVGCDLVAGTLLQSRTGGTGTDNIQYLTLRSAFSVVTLAGAVDPGGNQTPVNFVTVESGGQLNLTDPVGSSGTCFQNSHVSSNAFVSGTGTGLVSACRFSAHATVNLGAFSHDGCVVDGGFTVTATAGNINALANKSFNDWT